MSDPVPLAFISAPAAPTTANFLLWGPPKSGKSTAAATAPGPILWINAEGPGALGYARKTAAGRGTQIHEVAIGKHPGASTDAANVLDSVYRHIRDGLEPRVHTIVVDTLAKVRDALVAQWVVPGSSNSLKQYGKVADKLGGFINTVRDLDVNVVFIAHADVSDDAESGRVVRPLIGGKLTEIVPGEVDVVAYCSPSRTEDGVRYYGQLVEGKGRTGLGDRSGGIADERGIRELNLSAWLDDYRAALTPDDSDLPFAPADEKAHAEADLLAAAQEQLGAQDVAA